VERRAVEDSVSHAGASEFYPIKQPLAAAIGAGLPVAEPAGNMVVDIGGGTAEIAVISLANIVQATSLRVGGDAFDNAIKQHLKNAHNLKIGERTAEEIKLKIGSAFPLEEEMTMEVRGLSIGPGLPNTVTVRSEEIRDALRDPLQSIQDSIRQILEQTPPELAGDLVDRGIVMAGGGALLRGIDRLVAKETGLPVTIADDPLISVANGTGQVLQNIDYWRAAAGTGA